MSLHPIYIRLTGSTRLRQSWFGRLVMQVETIDGEWQDATAHDLIAIEFLASSSFARRTPNASPRDWPLDSFGGPAHPLLRWL